MNITIYTTNTCAYCVMVKKWLASKGKEYSEINIDEQPEKQQEAIELTGSMSVPITLIKNNDETRVVVGFNIPQLAAAIQ